MSNSTQQPKSILYVVSDDWYFCSHRLPIAIKARDNGFSVSVICNVKNHGEKIKKLGFNLIPMSLVRSSVNPVQFFLAFLKLLNVIRKMRPSIIHNIAAKSVILGMTSAVFFRNIKVINQLPGLGVLAYYRFSGFKRVGASILFNFVVQLIKRIKCSVIVQNSEDLKTMNAVCQNSLSNAFLIKGSGVDSAIFMPQPIPCGPKKVALVARMIELKGIDDFIRASKIIWNINKAYRFVLVGDTDHGNRSAILEHTLEKYSLLPNVEWWGHVDDVREVWSKCCIACLPTKYPEGIPMSLLEAAACGRPIVATGMPGCLEVVCNGINGTIVPESNPKALATALLDLLEDSNLCEKYGAYSRRLVLDKFDKTIIENETLALYEETVGVEINGKL